MNPASRSPRWTPPPTTSPRHTAFEDSPPSFSRPREARPVRRNTRAEERWTTLLNTSPRRRRRNLPASIAAANPRRPSCNEKKESYRKDSWIGSLEKTRSNSSRFLQRRLLYLDSGFGGVRLNDVPKLYTVKSGFRRP